MARWGILWRSLQFKLAQSVRIVRLAILLHKFCIYSGDKSVSGLVTEDEYERIMQFNQELTSQIGTGMAGRRLSTQRSNRRNMLVDNIVEGEHRRYSTAENRYNNS